MTRAALLIATEKYDDRELRPLHAPAADVAAFAEVLRERGFDSVETCVDRDESQLRLAVATVLADRGPDDLVVVYISAHGLLDLGGRLYFAATNTLSRKLNATGLDSRWVDEQLRESNAGGRVLILDCCFSGAYGMWPKAAPQDPIAGRLGTGYIVLTAASDIDYAYEAAGDGDDGEPAVRSVFTGALIDGIRTGRADVDADGWISTHDLYQHALAAMGRAGDQRPRYYSVQAGDVRLCAVDGTAAAAALPSLAPELRRLLVVQADDAGKHQYQFFDGHVPLAGKIYVEQRVETSPAALVTGESGIPGLLTVREVLNRPAEFANVLLVGGPGMGKSTVISQIVREQSAWLLGEGAAPDADPAPFGSVIPVALPARLLVGRSLPAALAAVCDQSGPGLADRILHDAPAPGKSWLVLIDGVDEVLRSAERSEVINGLADWLSRSDATHRFLITTRPLSYGELPELRSQGIGEFSLQPFAPGDVRQFATNLFTARLGTSRRGEALDSAELFERQVSSARLRPVVHVPLLATIAALVFESDRDGVLPTSRAGLYEKFVEHLIYGRKSVLEQRASLRREFQSFPGGEQSFDWLAGNLRRLLEHLADRQLAGREAALLIEADRWVARHCPVAGITAIPGWRRSLQSLLASSGVLTPSSGDLVFTHRSLAEYLAAGPRADVLDIADWLTQARAPDTRNLALFVLARSLEPAEPLVRTLLDRRGDDLVVAGDIVADGLDIGPALRAEVLDQLFGSLAEEDPTAPEALRVLTTLAADPAVGDRLRALAADDGARPWVRLLLADLLDAADLRRLIDAVPPERAARQWVNQQLLRRGEEPLVDPSGEEETGLGMPSPLARHAYREALTATQPGSPAFLAYALALADSGDPAGPRALQDCVTDLRLRADLRLQAARALLKVVPERAADLRGIAAADPADEIRTPIVTALAEVEEAALPPIHPGDVHSPLEARTDSDGDSRIVAPASGGGLRVVGGLPLRNMDFVGRDELLYRLTQALEARPTGSIAPVTLHGMGGVGKTQVAAEFAYRHLDRYDVVWWIPADHTATVLNSLRMLAERLGLPLSQDLRETVDGVHQALAQTDRPWLLIFDNADTPAEVLPHVPPAGRAGGHVIITSRDPSWAGVSEPIEVDVFARAESIALISRRNRVSVEDADRMADVLGDLPLALEQAAAWQATTGMPASEYLELFDKHVRELMSEGRPASYPTSAAASVSLTLDRLRTESPATAQLLELFAFLGPDPVSVGLLRHGRIADLSEPLRRMLAEPLALNRAVRDLRRYGLARVDSAQRIQVHRLVQMLLRTVLDEERALKVRRDTQNLLAAANPGNPDDPQTWPSHREIGAHLLPAALIEAVEPDAWRSVLDQIRFRLVIGDYENARQLGELALHTWRTADGPGVGASGELTMLAAQHLADALRALGSYDRAARLATEVREMLSQFHSPDDEIVLAAAIGAGKDLRIGGRYREALEIDEDTLARQVAAYGDDDPMTLRAMQMVAADHRLLGQFGRAHELDREAADRWEQVSAADDLHSLLCGMNLTRDLLGLGRYADAREAGWNFHSQLQRQLGRAHPAVLSAGRVVGVALRKSGHYAEGLNAIRENYRDLHARLGPDHEYLLLAAMSQANALRVTGEPAAVGAADTAAASHRRVFGERHPLTLAATVNLAIALRLDRQLEEARKLDETTLVALREALGPEHDFTLCAQSGLANDRSLAGDHDEALALSEVTWSLSQRMRGKDHPYTFACGVNFAIDLAATGDEGSARDLRAVCLAGLVRSLGADHPVVLDAGRGRRLESDIEPPQS